MTLYGPLHRRKKFVLILLYVVQKARLYLLASISLRQKHFSDTYLCFFLACSQSSLLRSYGHPWNARWATSWTHVWQIRIKMLLEVGSQSNVCILVQTQVRMASVRLFCVLSYYTRSWDRRSFGLSCLDCLRNVLKWHLQRFCCDLWTCHFLVGGLEVFLSYRFQEFCNLLVAVRCINLLLCRCEGSEVLQTSKPFSRQLLLQQSLQ